MPGDNPGRLQICHSNARCHRQQFVEHGIIDDAPNTPIGSAPHRNHVSQIRLWYDDQTRGIPAGRAIESSAAQKFRTMPGKAALARDVLSFTSVAAVRSSSDAEVLALPACCAGPPKIIRKVPAGNCVDGFSATNTLNHQWSPSVAAITTP